MLTVTCMIAMLQQWTGINGEGVGGGRVQRALCHAPEGCCLLEAGRARGSTRLNCLPLRPSCPQHTVPRSDHVL